MYLYIEFFLYILYYLLIERHHVAACRATTVNKHESLLVVHTSMPKRLSFPTALFYHPSGRNLYVFIINDIVRHADILGSKALIYISVDNRVHKETSGIAHDLRVWQFSLTYLYNSVAKLLGSWNTVYAFCSKGLTDVAVVKGRNKREKRYVTCVMRNLSFHSCLKRLWR